MASLINNQSLKEISDNIKTPSTSDNSKKNDIMEKLSSSSKINNKHNNPSFRNKIETNDEVNTSTYFSSDNNLNGETLLMKQRLIKIEDEMKDFLKMHNKIIKNRDHNESLIREEMLAHLNKNTLDLTCKYSTVPSKDIRISGEYIEKVVKIKKEVEEIKKEYDTAIIPAKTYWNIYLENPVFYTSVGVIGIAVVGASVYFLLRDKPNTKIQKSEVDSYQRNQIAIIEAKTALVKAKFSNIINDRNEDYNSIHTKNINDMKTYEENMRIYRYQGAVLSLMVGATLMAKFMK